IDECTQHELDRLRCPSRDEHSVGRQRPSATRVLFRHRLSRRRDAGRRTIPVLAIAKCPLDGFDEMRRGLESESRWVPDVQVPNPSSGSFDTKGLRYDVADRVGEMLY